MHEVAGDVLKTKQWHWHCFLSLQKRKHFSDCIFVETMCGWLRTIYVQIYMYV
jgi:hypothetical protein